MLLVGLLWVPGASTASAQTVVMNREYSIKAAFLYQFSKYIQWPGDTYSSDEAPFVIGIAGSNPFGTTLDTIAERKKAAGRSIQIVDVTDTSNSSQCQILFFPGDELDATQKDILAAAKDSHVLTVGESEEFIANGGKMQLYLEDNKVRFAVSRHTIDDSTLKISSKLLSLAKIVDSEASTSP